MITTKLVSAYFYIIVLSSFSEIVLSGKGSLRQTVIKLTDDNCTFFPKYDLLINEEEIVDLSTDKTCAGHSGDNVLEVNWKSTSSSFFLNVYESDLSYTIYQFERNIGAQQGAHNYSCKIRRNKLEEWRKIKLSCSETTTVSCQPKYLNNRNYYNHTKITDSIMLNGNIQSCSHCNWCEEIVYNNNGLISVKLQNVSNNDILYIQQWYYCPHYIKIQNDKRHYEYCISLEGSENKKKVSIGLLTETESVSILIESSAIISSPSSCPIETGTSCATTHCTYKCNLKDKSTAKACWNDTPLVIERHNNIFLAKWTLVHKKCIKDFIVYNSFPPNFTIYAKNNNNRIQIGSVPMSGKEYRFEIPLKYIGSTLEIKPSCPKHPDLDCACFSISGKISASPNTETPRTATANYDADASTTLNHFDKNISDVTAIVTNSNKFIYILTGVLVGIVILAVLLFLIICKCKFKKNFQIVHLICDTDKKENFLIQQELFNFLKVSKLNIVAYDLTKNVADDVKYFLLILSEDEKFNKRYLNKLETFKNSFIYASFNENLKPPIDAKVYYIPKDMRKLLKTLGVSINENIYELNLSQLKNTIKKVENGLPVPINYQRQNNYVHDSGIIATIPPEAAYNVEECKEEYVKQKCRNTNFDDDKSSTSSDIRRHSDPICERKISIQSISKTSVV